MSGIPSKWIKNMDTKTKLQIAEKATIAVKFLDGFRPKEIKLPEAELGRLKLATKLAGAVYDLKDFEDSPSVELLNTFNGLKGANAFLFKIGGDLWLVWKGTAEIEDILADLDPSRVLVKGLGNVRGGFYESMNEVFPDIVNTLKALPADTLFYVAGHSLGAAHAVLFTWFYRNLNTSLEITATYAIACPQCLSKEAAVMFDATITTPVYCVSNSLDPVTRLLRVGGWRSVGTQLFLPFGKSGIYHYSWAARIMSVYSAIRIKEWHGFKQAGKDVIGYHLVKNYIERLSRQ